MSFRGREDSSLVGKMEPGGIRKFDSDKGDPEDRASRFDPGRGRRPPFGGRGRRPSPPGRDKPFPDRQRDFGGYGRNEEDFPPPGGRDMMRDRSPLHAPEDRYSDRFKKNDRREDASRKDAGARPYYDEPPRDRYMSMEGRGRYEGSPMDFKHRPAGYSAPPPKEYSDGFPKPNECEIIAMNRQQRSYAESVETRIKGLGILVDVLFLKDEALLTQTIDDIARKGSLYAMVISPQNETHRSVTVNILHGTPQEHRNMPLEDALKLVSRNFHEYVRSQKEHMERERAERGPYTGAVSADREMQLLLRMLADGRWVSLAEINSVILYLTERRDKMRGDERVRPGIPPPNAADTLYKPPPAAIAIKDDADVAQKEQDLQNRIMNIMNQGAPALSNAAPVEGRPGDVPARAAMGEVMPPKLDALPETASFNPVSKSESATTPTYINFDNPSVKKALDNLMQSGPNLLKSISLNSSSSPGAVPPKSTIGGGGARNEGMGGQNMNQNLRHGMGGRGMPDVSGGRGMPDVSGGRGMADVSGGRGMPDVSGGRGMVDISGGRGMPDVSGGRGMPDVSGGRGMPDISGGRGMPDVSGGRGMPDVSGSRGMPDVSGGRGMPDVSGGMPGRNNQAGMDVMSSRSNIPGMGGLPSRPSGAGGYGGMNPVRGSYGGAPGDQGMGMSEMTRMGQQRGGNMAPPQGQDMGRGPPMGMNQGGGFPGQNQFNKYQGPGQQGNFPPFNSGNMGGMPPRPNFGGPQGMGGGPPRRF